MFWTEATPHARRALLAAAAGWMLDAMDVLLYAFVLDHVRAEFGIDDRTSGLLLALPLLASAVGGVLFGWLADRFGRTRALMASILVYSVATAACGLVELRLAAGGGRLLVGLGWAASGRPARRWWPRRGRPSTAARRSA